MFPKGSFRKFKRVSMCLRAVSCSSQHIAEHYFCGRANTRHGIQKSHKYPGGQAVWGSLRTRILAGKATSLLLELTIVLKDFFDRQLEKARNLKCQRQA